MSAPDETGPTVKLCEVDSLADGDLARAEIDGRPIAYARIGDDWFAIDDTCTHAKVSLADGIIDEDDLTIECPKHGALFSLETGEALTLPAIKPLTSHAISVRETGVFISVAQQEEST
jgi:3-phenylpropionate/trans-cinnamate dioxygenase ferredoxin subunit